MKINFKLNEKITNHEVPYKFSNNILGKFNEFQIEYAIFSDKKLLFKNINNTSQIDVIFDKLPNMLDEINYLYESIDIVFDIDRTLEHVYHRKLSIYQERFQVVPISLKSSIKTYLFFILPNFFFLRKIFFLVKKFVKK